MWFLIRVGFWLSLVILLLPTGQPQAVAEGPQVGAMEAISAAGAAVSDARQFCERQPEACAVGSQALTAFGHKAQAATKMVYDFLTDKLRPEATSVAGGPTTIPSADGKPGDGKPGDGKPGDGKPGDTKPAAGTLTPHDRAPAWRGPAGRPEMLAHRE